MRPTPRSSRVDPRPDTRAGDAVQFAARRAVDTVEHVKEICSPTGDEVPDGAEEETLDGARHLDWLADQLIDAASRARSGAATLRAAACAHVGGRAA